MLSHERKFLCKLFVKIVFCYSVLCAPFKFSSFESCLFGREKNNSKRAFAPSLVLIDKSWYPALHRPSPRPPLCLFYLLFIHHHGSNLQTFYPFSLILTSIFRIRNKRIFSWEEIGEERTSNLLFRILKKAHRITYVIFAQTCTQHYILN